MSHRTAGRRQLWRGLLTLALLLAAAVPAGAHSSLVASRPLGGQVLDAPPARVSLTFSEALGEAGTVTVREVVGCAATLRRAAEEAAG